MSNIRLQGNPSGTGTLTIASPNTNSDFTLNLPASAGTIPVLSSVTNNGVVFINGSGQATSGSALTFDGTNFATTGSGTLKNLLLSGGTLPGAGNPSIALRSSDNVIYHQSGSANTIVMLDSAQNTMQSIGATAQIWNISNAEQMRLTSTGLGIGTSSPSAPVDIQANSGGTGIRIRGRAAGNSGALRFFANDNTTQRARFESNDTSFEINSIANLPITISTNDTERARISSNGLMGIGMTPTGSYSLQIYGIGSVTSASARIRLQNSSTGSADADGGGIAMEGNNLIIQNSENGYAAFEINGSERARITSAGDLVLGRTAPDSSIEVFRNNSAGPTIGINNGATGGRSYQFFSHSNTNDIPGGFGLYDNSSGGGYRWVVTSGGQMLVGKTSTDEAVQGLQLVGPSGLLVVTRNNGDPLSLRRTSSDGAIASFRRDATLVGTISVTTSATAYNTSSDYRLKEQVQPMTGALAKVSALKPVTYKWKADGSDGEGFIAHELAEVVPQCVTGEKDAVDAEGKPVYQGIDTSFLVATLTAAIQEQQAIIEQLTTRIAALEAK